MNFLEAENRVTEHYREVIEMLLKRKLTRKESTQITDEVMAMGLKDSHSRFTMAILKTMEVVNR